MSETKRRLLISRWRAREGVAAELEERIKELRASHMNLEADLEEANDSLEEAEAERDAYAADLEAALVDVKYWLHEGLVHGKLVSKPREMLRRIEDLVG